MADEFVPTPHYDMTPPIRKFDTGATRDSTEGKLEYKGFLSPQVLRRFAQYMHAHRIQSDGSLRDSDNWKKGIPVDSYVDSGLRHMIDLWIQYDETGHIDEDLACAVFFNIQGMLHETLRESAI